MGGDHSRKRFTQVKGNNLRQNSDFDKASQVCSARPQCSLSPRVDLPEGCRAGDRLAGSGEHGVCRDQV